MIIDLRKGFGKFDDYELIKFPDNSIKFTLKEELEEGDNLAILTTFRTNDDILTLGFVANVIEHTYPLAKIVCAISYMMYQQDDRQFDDNESFGLKVVCGILNSFPILKYAVFHPHSDKVEMLRNCTIITNDDLLDEALPEFGLTNATWIIPDAGAFKTQFKQIEKRNHKNFVVALKSRDHQTGEVTTVVHCDDLQGADCFIVDDICLGGRTFINLATQLKAKNCGKLTLIVSHGVFNFGVDHLFEHFDNIITTDSICGIHHEKLTIKKIEYAV